MDGACVYRHSRLPRFQRVKRPDISELEELVRLISQRVGRCLERQGLLWRGAEHAWPLSAQSVRSIEPVVINYHPLDIEE
jgi:hypothetical protein